MLNYKSIIFSIITMALIITAHTCSCTCTYTQSSDRVINHN